MSAFNDRYAASAGQASRTAFCGPAVTHGFLANVTRAPHAVDRLARSPHRALYHSRVFVRQVRACAPSDSKEATSSAESVAPEQPSTVDSSAGNPTKAEDAETSSASYLNVPGKIVLNELELAKQSRELDELATKYRKARLRNEYEDARLFGWVTSAERLNGRTAMFFFLVGLLTEYWTGYTVPQQVELMLNTVGVYF